MYASTSRVPSRMTCVVVWVVQCAARLVVQAGQRRDGALVFGQQRLREIRVVQLLVGVLLNQRPHLVVQGAGGDNVTGGRFGFRQHLEDGFLDAPLVLRGAPWRLHRGHAARPAAALRASLRRCSASRRSVLVAPSNAAAAWAATGDGTTSATLPLSTNCGAGADHVDDGGTVSAAAGSMSAAARNDAAPMV